MTTQAECWQCRQALADIALFCHGCGAVQPVRVTSPFMVLGLSPVFSLDMQQLETHYLGKARTIHPDRFAAKSPQEQNYAQQHASAVNNAYQTLKDPYQRGQWLYASMGGQASPDTTQHQDILLTALEARERLDAAADAKALEALRQQAVAAQHQAVETLAAAFMSGDLAGIAKALTALRYAQKFHAAVMEAVSVRA